jgi:rod shape determining protein RodA
MFSRAFDIVARRIDGPLMAIICVIIAFGLAVIFSATSGTSDRVILQARNFGLGLGVLWIVANIPPNRLMQLAVPIYVIGLMLLVGVAVAGDVRNGARRWLNLGVTSIQPSEIMKLAVPAVLAWYFQRRESALGAKDFIIAAAILAVPMLLTMKQPDLGTALLIASSGVFVIFLAGLPWKAIFTLTVAGIAFLPIAWNYILHDYQRQRVMTLIDPSSDPQGAGYHITQASIAIGSGGWFGKGWLTGSQGQLDFIPERHTDFILAVLGEEFGLIGILALTVLYLLLITRGFYITMQARGVFSRLLAGAVTLTFFIYAFVNLGMVMGILPVVGVPLPLVSFGGTAVLTMMLSFGILMSVHSHKNQVAA